MEGRDALHWFFGLRRPGKRAELTKEVEGGRNAGPDAARCSLMIMAFRTAGQMIPCNCGGRDRPGHAPLLPWNGLPLKHTSSLDEAHLNLFVSKRRTQIYDFFTFR